MATIVENRKNGELVSYRFRCYMGRDELGKQIVRYRTWKIPKGLSPSKARKAAESAAAQWERESKEEYDKDLLEPERVKARVIERARNSFTDFVMQEWFPTCIDNGERKPKTVAFYSDTTKNIVQYFSGCAIQSISPTEAQKFLSYLRTSKGYAPQNIHHHYRTMKMIFDFAVKQEVISKNPIDKVDKPKLAKKKVDALSHDEAVRFFTLLNDCPLEFRCILNLLTTTGVRRGELLGLHWEDVDFGSSVLYIRRNVSYTSKSGIVVDTPKTAASVRVIPILSGALELLAKLKDERQVNCTEATFDKSFIFPSKESMFAPRSPSAITQRVKRFMKTNEFHFLQMD